MAAVIHKYIIDESEHNIITDYFIRVLTVQMQYDQIAVWAIVDPDEYNNGIFELEPTKVDFQVYGTGPGWNIPSNKESEYLGTVQDNNGYVWHIFYKIV